MVIWATSEYHNAGGWPTGGFSQSSGIHDVWNSWIIYPLIALGLFITARAWSVYGRKPISKKEIDARFFGVVPLATIGAELLIAPS